MKMILKYKNKRILLDVKKCNEFGKFWGLMFSNKKNAQALLFEFKKSGRRSIHSFFCPEFIGIWLDDKNKIVDIRIVKPWKFSVRPLRPFSKLIEIPLNERYEKIVKFLVGSAKSL